MPSYLDFSTTKSFRDFLISKTLNVPNGPQTFTATNYQVQNLNSFPNVDPGDVESIRPQELIQTQNSNIYKPTQYFIHDTINTIPHTSNLQLYPYFTSTDHSLIGIFTANNFNSESELFKFAAHYIKDERNGPLHSRIEQNLYKSTVGRVNLIDALNGNTSTAINILTGKQPLIEPNNEITVSSSLVGKTVDFMETIGGISIPVSKIPGNYLSDPSNPTNYRPTSSTEVGAVWQDVTGVLGSIVGVARRPKRSDKPSDLFLQYTGDGQKKHLYNLLSYSKYAPNYSVSARSQQSSKIFNFIDEFAEGIKNIVGIDAKAVKGISYIGDDRGDNVLNVMSDANGIVYRSSYYLSLMFDPIQTELLKREKPIEEGGSISGKLTWISKNTTNTLGKYDNDNFTSSKSTNYKFREDSLLTYTQSILNSMPKGGQARSHVGNVIDQTSRVFRESGDNMLSRGSAVKKFEYINQKTGEETGVEYCRVWTKDSPYATYGNTMKKSGSKKSGNSYIYRSFNQNDSVLNDAFNLNIGPMSNGTNDPNGTNSFANSTNIVNGYKFGGGFYAKKYMFSIENLAWKSSTKEGFTVSSLPFCERGPNGGRVMWFPPYDLKVNETNTANWEKNSFIGRPEPIFTYRDTERSGTISFKVVVDHPSILNLLVREEFKSMSDTEADNYINSFFSGCKDLDFYEIVKKYSYITPDDATLIQRYLNVNTSPEIIDGYVTTIDEVKNPIPNNPNSEPVGETINLKFQNDIPGGTTDKSDKSFTTLYNDYKKIYTTYKEDLSNNIDLLVINSGNTLTKNDLTLLFGSNYNLSDVNSLKNKATFELQKIFDKLDDSFNNYNDDLNALKVDLDNNLVQFIEFNVDSSTSILNYQTTDYNLHLSYRRSHSIITDVISKISKDGVGSVAINKLNLSWKYNKTSPLNINSITLKDLGYGNDGKINITITNKGEDGNSNGIYGCKQAKFQTNFTTLVHSLSVVAPISSSCRQANFNYKYFRTQENKNNETTNNNSNILSQTKLVKGIPVSLKNKSTKPPIDVLKRIIMKTLSECYYFKKLEETDTMLYKSLREKLKFFHPGFHSTTPEGLNSRLTFLQQCIRPGDTMPIKGVSDVNDLNARNTTFGAPPICVLRIGDFYHSKIVINNIQITYEEGNGMLWDMNPEGIGMQPMIANVTLQCNFIGGQGLSKPIEKLQNALSSNFYANTEMYDERAVSTLSGNDLKKYEDYSKSFLSDLNSRINNQNIAGKSSPSNQKNITPNVYIGTLISATNNLSYTSIVKSFYDNSRKYFIYYTYIVENLIKTYDTEIAGLLLSNKYRTIKKYDVFSDAGVTPSLSLELLGLFPTNKDLTILLDDLESVLIQSITISPVNTTGMFTNLSNDLMGIDFSKISSTASATLMLLSDERLQPFIIDKIKTKISKLKDENVNFVEDQRNLMLNDLDKLNFIVKRAHDGFFDGSDVKKVELTGFTSSNFYKKYSEVVTFISEKHHYLTDDITNSYDFSNPSNLTKEQIKNIIGIFLKDSLNDFLKIYDNNPIFTKNIKSKLGKSYDKFTVVPNVVKIKKLSYKERKDTKEINYGLLPFESINDDLTKTELLNINSDNVSPIDNKLNYYKKKK